MTELNNNFEKAIELFNKIDSIKENDLEIDNIINLLLQCEKDVIKEGIYSKNEEIDDINTEDLKYLQIPFYISQLLQKVSFLIFFKF